jgi:hypothetical protein
MDIVARATARVTWRDYARGLESSVSRWKKGNNMADDSWPFVLAAPNRAGTAIVAFLEGKKNDSPAKKASKA